jgi:hypothetical protein
MGQNKKYEDYQVGGFERQQLWKEHEGPMIRRQTALNASQSFFANNDIKYSAIELKALYKNFLNLIENGDDAFFERLDIHIKKNKKPMVDNHNDIY